MTRPHCFELVCVVRESQAGSVLVYQVQKSSKHNRLDELLNFSTSCARLPRVAQELVRAAHHTSLFAMLRPEPKTTELAR